MKSYGDILHLPRPEIPAHPRMLPPLPGMENWWKKHSARLKPGPGKQKLVWRNRKDRMK